MAIFLLKNRGLFWKSRSSVKSATILNLCCHTVGEYLRYHRQLQGKTTREVAESVGIVPATSILYENDINIKYRCFAGKGVEYRPPAVA